MSKPSHYLINQITLIASAAVTSAVIYLMAKRFVPYGVEGEWTWPPAFDANWKILPAVLLVLFVISIVVGIVSWRIGKSSARWEIATVILSIVIALTLQFTIGYMGGARLNESVHAIYNPWCSGYWTKASKIKDMDTFLTKYRIRMDASSLGGEYHTHFPGPTLLFWLIDYSCRQHPRFASDFLSLVEKLPDVKPEAFDALGEVAETQKASIWLSAFVTRFIACLAIVPLYLLVRCLYTKEIAFFAATFYSVIPSLLLFSPGVDQMFPLLALTLCYCHYQTIIKNSYRWACLTGLAAFLSLYCSLALVIVLFFNVITTVLKTMQKSDTTDRRVRWRSLIKLGAVSLTSFAVITFVLLIAFHHNIFKIWFQAYERNKIFNAMQARTYWKWLLFNPVEFLVFLGIPTAVLFMRRTVGELSRPLRAMSLTYFKQADLLLLSFIIVLLLLDVSGQNRGEVARLWIYLMPYATIIAARELNNFGNRRHLILAFLVGLQFLQAIVFKCILDVLGLYGTSMTIHG